MIDKCLPDLQNPSRVLLEQLNEDGFFQVQYAKDAGVVQGYTLFEHTAMVLGQFEKYFAVRPWTGAVEIDVFRLMLCLHDIGKPIAVERGDKKLQHGVTLNIIDQAIDEKRVLLTDRDACVVRALIDGDSIGSLLKGQRTVDESAAQIKLNAKASGLTLDQFFSLLVKYYQSDAGSYTADAGGVEALDFLFVQDKIHQCFTFYDQEERLFFSESVEQNFKVLQKELFH